MTLKKLTTTTTSTLLTCVLLPLVSRQILRPGRLRQARKHLQPIAGIMPSSSRRQRSPNTNRVLIMRFLTWLTGVLFLIGRNAIMSQVGGSEPSNRTRMVISSNVRPGGSSGVSKTSKKMINELIHQQPVGQV